jgi:diguanylate cyclase (GGDEF)-like protein
MMARATSLHRRLPALVLVALAFLASAVVAISPAHALKAISVTGNEDRIEVTARGEIYEGRGDALQIETAPAADGATARIAVRASVPGANPNWLVFALTNQTNKAVELWLAADRYNPIGSGIVWPDLDSRRIAAVTNSAGFAPERIRNDRVDIYRLTIERGQTITYVAELASERLSRIYLWKPIEFEQRQRERQLFNGIMLGITGLLAVFLTAVFAANHKAIFPTAALVAWCALGLLCVDFGFWHKLFQMKPEDNAQYRAAAEAALAASLVIFLAAFLRVNLWSGFARMLFVVWIVAQLAIVGLAILDPRLAATVARLSLAVIGGLGIVIILLLSLRGLDRALALMPTWILFLVWLFAAAVALTGRLAGEFAISGMVSGLVLILVLIGFTVTQYAFRSAEPALASGHGGHQLRLAAMDRAGVAYWEWNLRRDELRVDPEIEAALGLGAGELPTRIEQLVAYLHPADRERFKLELAAIREREGGTLRTGIRVRHADSSYRWLDFEGASVPTSDRRNLRCVGLVRDMTDTRRAQERLLNNAVYDSLTSLPNRELLIDRLGTAMQGAASGPDRQVAVFMIDVDRFRAVNTSFGLVVGDSIILTVSRRIARIVGTTGTLARIGGDQFAAFLVGQNDPRELAAFAERVRLSLRSPIRIAGQEIVLTGSIGIAIHDGTAESPRALLRDAEVAMHRAKRQGSDRAEIFSPEMKSERQERIELERELARALEQRQLRVLYQPIVSLTNDDLVGFEAIVRWQHPRLGMLSPIDFLPTAEGAGLVVRLGSFIIGRAIADIGRWQQELARPERPLFVTVGVASRELISPELIQELRHTRAGAVLPAGTIKLAIPEPVVMENPEQASHLLEMLKEAGVELWLDRYGTGYTSPAYLSRFPFETFRLDRALVEWSGQGERDASVVRSLVAVAHELGRQVAGDGIAQASDAAFLRAAGCQFAQGFHYGEPMGEEEVVRLLRLIGKSERRMRRRGMVRTQEKRKAQDGTAQRTGTPDDAVAAPAAPQPSPATPPMRGHPAGGAPTGPSTRPTQPSDPFAGRRPPSPPPGDGRPPVAASPRATPAGWPPSIARPNGHGTAPPAPPTGPSTGTSPRASGQPAAPPTMPSGEPVAPIAAEPLRHGPRPRPSGAPLPAGVNPTLPPGSQSQPAPAEPPAAGWPPQPRQAPPGPVTTALAHGSPVRAGEAASAPVQPPPATPPPMPANSAAPPPVDTSAAPPLPATGEATPSPASPRSDPRTGDTGGSRADLSTLSPNVAASLARLAGRARAAAPPPRADETDRQPDAKKPDAAE